MGDTASTLSTSPTTSVVIVVGMGIAGGIINCLMFEEGLTSPYVFTNKKGKKSWNPGFLTNVFLGITASFLSWAFGAYELNWERQAGICLLAGIGGGNFISTYLKKQQLNVAESKAAQYLDMVVDDLPEESPEEVEDEVEKK